ncbi:MAG: hypothetical protein DRJ13_18325 [Bacteroidetes bacterium]|nr:MAG: hypothetical protein DRJ13_18325 [Bacteroidota bacterium]
MSYSKFLKAQGKSGKPPTIEKTEMSVEEKKRTQKGLCIKCGQNMAEKSSYVCTECQSEDTLEDIQNEIQALRQRLLKT